MKKFLQKMGEAADSVPVKPRNIKILRMAIKAGWFLVATAIRAGTQGGIVQEDAEQLQRDANRVTNLLDEFAE